MSQNTETLLHTPLYDEHVALGARMVPFAGWEMPVQYTGVIEEHNAVRQHAGMFDVSHMGRFEVHGAGRGALPALHLHLGHDPPRSRARATTPPPATRPAASWTTCTSSASTRSAT